MVRVEVMQETWLAVQSLWQLVAIAYHTREDLPFPHHGSSCQSEHLAFGGSSSCSELWGSSRSSSSVAASELPQEGMDPILRGQMFREEIRRILLTADLCELDGPVAHALLDP